MTGAASLCTLVAQAEADKMWIEGAMETLVGYVWWWPLIILCVGSGLVFTILTRGVQFRAFGHAIQVVRGKYDKPEDAGEISHFKALTTALSATVGLGNISGVAIAISVGGPGAVFWMWVIGLLGMAVKFAECSLAMKFRHEFADGHVGGGPMYTIERGLGKNWTWMAVAFAVMVTISSFGGGNMFQTNQAASIFATNFGIEPWITGIAITTLVGLVIIGGIQRIGQVTSFLVPFMCGIYILGAIVILILNASAVPGVFGTIFENAFSSEPLLGGTLGVVITQGVRRATFSNEAGLGSAPIAHAAAKTDEPIREGVVASLGPFIDTIVVCTMTALIIIITGAYNPDIQGVEVTAHAFDAGIDGFGQYFVPIAVLMFAVSTVISWSYYGEKGIEFLARKIAPNVVKPAVATYKALFCVAAFFGSVFSLDLVVNFSDAMLGMMAVPNLIACLLLAPLLLKMTKSYFDRLKAGEFDVQK
jgi:AGCS family alanine or glycine:cation symporter